MVLKVVLAFVILLVAVILMIWFERKLIAGMQNRIGPVWAGPWGLLHHAGRRHQADPQGRPHPDERVALRVQAGAVPVGRARVRDVLHRARSAATSATATTAWSTIFGQETLLQVADPPIGILLMLAMSSDRRLRRDAGRLVVGLEVPAARLGAGHGPDGQLRGGARPVGGHGRAGGRHALAPTASSWARTTSLELEHGRHRRRAVHRLHHRRHRRAEPPAVRPRRGRAGDRRRLPHRVLLVPLRRVLPGGVPEPRSTMSAIIVTLFLGGPRGLFDIPIIPPVPESVLWLLAKILVLPVRLRLVPGHAAPPPLRPAHGSRLEDPHPRRLRLVPPHHRAAPGRRRGWNRFVVAGVALVVRCWPLRPAPARPSGQRPATRRSKGRSF